MQVIEAKDKIAFNSALASRKDITGGQFLQSWEWGEFQESLGRKVFRFVAVEGEEILASALLIKHDLSAGKSYLYCPRGPVVRFKISDLRFKNTFNLLIGKVKEIAEKENAIFFRFEPPTQLATDNLQLTTYNLQLTNAVQPKDTLILDISKSEEELLAGMHPKTRYNIKLAEKKGVTVRSMNNESRVKDIELFLELMKSTAARDGFKLHSDDYYRKMTDFFSAGIEPIAQSPSLKASLYFAEYENKVVASNLVMFFGNTATYLHGASGSEFRNVMAPYLLHWHIIQDARKMGYQYYDWWGIVPSLAHRPKPIAQQHNWAGITRFKKGFGGKEVSYIGALDVIFNPLWYGIYKITKNIRKLIRHR